jgi:hypothetical protein
MDTERSFSIADELMMEMAPPPPPPNSADLMFFKEQDASVKEQMLIRTAYITFEVDNYPASMIKIDSIVKSYKSWISSEDMQNSDYRISNYMAIRVPSASLSQLILKLLTVAKKVDNQRIESTDVTEEYIDKESRLNNQKAIEKKFTALLRQTNSIEDILKIESKLAEIRGEIESLEGRMRYLNNRVSFSTINLNIYQKIDFKYSPEPMESFWERLKKSIHSGWKGLVGFFLFLFRLWPLWLIAALAWFLVKRFMIRRARKPIIEAIQEKEKHRSKSKKKSKGRDKDNKQERNLPNETQE